MLNHLPPTSFNKQSSADQEQGCEEMHCRQVEAMNFRFYWDHDVEPPDIAGRHPAEGVMNEMKEQRAQKKWAASADAASISERGETLKAASREADKHGSSLSRDHAELSTVPTGTAADLHSASHDTTTS